MLKTSKNLKYTGYTEERITRGKAIRLKCLDCCCGNNAEVRRCSVTNCPLWRYRMGNEKKTQKAENDSDSGINN